MKAIFPMPDMVLYIDCPGEIAFSRKDDAPDLEYLTDRRVLYKQLAEKYNWISIDGTLPIKEIASKIRGEVYERLKK
jgi:thymidylate kinase